MKNVDAVVAQIRASALALSNLADALEGKETVKAVEVEEKVEKEVEAKKEKSDEVKAEEVKEEGKVDKTYTFEEVRTLLTLKSREGKTEAVRALLQAYGVATLSALKKEDYAKVMKEAEGL